MSRFLFSSSSPWTQMPARLDSVGEFFVLRIGLQLITRRFDVLHLYSRSAEARLCSKYYMSRCHSVLCHSFKWQILCFRIFHIMTDEH